MAQPHGSGVELRNGYYEDTFNQLDHLGGGNFGTVYKVEKKPNGSGELYAVKKIKIFKDTLDSIRYDFPGKNPDEVMEREVLAMKALPPHPHIVAYVDSWYENMDDDGVNKYLYIQMELCQKETLLDYIQKLPHPPNNQHLKTTIEYFSQIVEGLCYLQAHDTPIIHRDVKPENIMISLEGKVKLGDFGIAAFGGTQTRTHTRGKGTPGWWAPEQATDQDRYNNKADIFSLGLILHYMLYKFLYDPPFTSRQAQENAVKRQFPHHLVEKYPLLFGLLKQMLNEERTERPSIKDVQEGLPSVISEILPNSHQNEETRRKIGKGLSAFANTLLIRSVCDHIGEDWKRLYKKLMSGRDPEVIESEVREIIDSYPGRVRMQAWVALRKWEVMNRYRSVEDRRRDLRQALVDIGRGDIARII